MLGPTERDGPLMPQVRNRKPQLVLQLVQGVTADVAQDLMLEVVPHILERIEMGCIPRQHFHAQPLRRSTRQEVLDQSAAMNGRAVPDDQNVASDVLQEVLEKSHDGLVMIGPALHPQQELPMLSQRANGHT